ncbi:MAG TPA: HypC/HybG/HupF family hydrogenase formation chaperone [Deltaproteobacteria bacterium]|nr:HypC/HybG/HupF family hydrogenase formation chaperone [Deltaproteobacteria bacterium]HPR56152.1 HypC/HybG/HupF family hydrogenase formation chaperone [Deltaproteobacteria bacterium]HXK47725.1 HypC/HybG/HupF family hydrogenase formation chaperone [Deltaproteobacteria bacterium]
MSIDENNYAVIDIGGTRREVCLDIIDEQVGIGDFVLCHAGFAIHKVDEAEAAEKLALLRELLEA